MDMLPSLLNGLEVMHAVGFIFGKSTVAIFEPESLRMKMESCFSGCAKR